MAGSRSAPKGGETAKDASPNGGSARQLEQLRVDIAGTIKGTFPWLFRITVAVAFALIVLVWLGFVLGKTMDATVLAASVQVAFGMVIGFVCVYLGLMMTWFGIDAAYTLKGSLGAGDAKVEGALKSASPGLLFALAGIVLIAVSLYKKIEYRESGYRHAGSIGAGSDTLDPERPQVININEGN